jgi:membrane protein
MSEQAKSTPTPDEPPLRGRGAKHPLALPWRGWRDVFHRVVQEVREDRLEIIAAGVAFYAILAVGPALAALVSIYGIFAQPEDLEILMRSVARLAPDVSRSLLLDQLLAPAIATAPSSLTVGAVVGVLVSLWSANRGMKALMTAINVAYEERRRRGFVHQTLLSLGMLTGAVVLFALAAVAVVAFPHLLRTTVFGDSLARLLTILRWPVLFAVFSFSLAALYRWAPVRRSPKWRWVSVGSIAATILWLGFCGLFSVYSRHVLELRGGYGAITGVVALALWLFGTAFVILLGAELNAEIEHQTGYDSTIGEPRPLGLRGAFAADHIGKPRG